MQYAKMGVSVVLTVLAALVPLLVNGLAAVTTGDWLNVAILAVTSAGIFAAPNVPHSKYTKAVLAVLGAVLAVLITSLTGGFTVVTAIQCVIAAANALGVYQVKNARSEVSV